MKPPTTDTEQAYFRQIAVMGRFVRIGLLVAVLLLAATLGLLVYIVQGNRSSVYEHRLRNEEVHVELCERLEQIVERVGRERQPCDMPEDIPEP